jgi:hypothetical protein
VYVKSLYAGFFQRAIVQTVSFLDGALLLECNTTLNRDTEQLFSRTCLVMSRVLPQVNTATHILAVDHQNISHLSHDKSNIKRKLVLETKNKTQRWCGSAILRVHWVYKSNLFQRVWYWCFDGDWGQEKRFIHVGHVWRNVARDIHLPGCILLVYVWSNSGKGKQSLFRVNSNRVWFDSQRNGSWSEENPYFIWYRTTKMQNHLVLSKWCKKCRYPSRCQL